MSDTDNFDEKLQDWLDKCPFKYDHEDWGEGASIFVYRKTEREYSN